MVKIKCQKSDLTIEASSGTDLIKICKKNPTLPIVFGCTRGNCGVCAVPISEGLENLTKCSSEEKQTLQNLGYDENYRLACQCAVNGDISIDI